MGSTEECGSLIASVTVLGDVYPASSNFSEPQFFVGKMGLWDWLLQTAVTTGWHDGCEAGGIMLLMAMVKTVKRRQAGKMQADCWGLVLRWGLGKLPGGGSS